VKEFFKTPHLLTQVLKYFKLYLEKLIINKMKTINPIKVILQFAAFIAVVSFLCSCSTTKGYNYSSHQRHNQKLFKQSNHKNGGRDLVDYKCSHRH
jgi:hypothetical protein